MSLKRLITQQRGGILVIVLAFMAITVPVTTATLAFVATLTKHSAVQQELLRAQYGGMGVREYAIHKLLVANGALMNNDPAPLDQLLSGPETVDLNGREHTITWSIPSAPEDEPEAEPIVFKTYTWADISVAGNNTTVNYTVEVHNLSNKPQTLQNIRNSLPARFDYVPNSTYFEGAHMPDMADFPHIERFEPPQGNAGRLENLVWPLDAEVGPLDHVTLEFQARTGSSVPAGAYCNIAWVDPGGFATGTDAGSAKILVGSPSPPNCADEVLTVTKKVAIFHNDCASNPALCPPQPQVAIRLQIDPITYKYTIQATNSGGVPIYLCYLFDWLPVGLTYDAGTYTTEVPGLQSNPTQTGQRVDARYQAQCQDHSAVIPADNQPRTFTLRATGALGFGANGDGIHQNSVRIMMAFSHGGQAHWAFSGLTADIVVYNVYWITIDEGNAVVRAEIWVNADGTATVGKWKPVN